MLGAALGRLIDRIPHFTIRIHGKPYLTRYFLTGKYARTLGEHRHLFLHHFHTSDRDRELHNHPYTGTSLILRGGYREERMEQLGHALLDYSKTDDMCSFVLGDSAPTYSTIDAKVCRPGDINHLGLNAFHRAELLDTKRGAWTLFLTGERIRHWGFLNKETLDFRPHSEARAEVLNALDDEVTHVFNSSLKETP